MERPDVSTLRFLDVQTPACDVGVMIIAIAGQKGGSGKSTVAIHLAAEWHRRGRRVLLVDADPQGTALTWGEVAAELGNDGPSVIAIGDNLRATLPELAAGFDVVVIDCPGSRHSRRQLGALAVADVAIIPCGPSTPDVWALAETIRLVDDVQAVRVEPLRAAVVVNRRSTTVEGRTARETLEQGGHLPVLRVELGQRVAYSEALAAGLGVTTYAGGSTAGVELRRLVDEVEDFAAADAVELGGARVA